MSLSSLQFTKEEKVKEPRLASISRAATSSNQTVAANSIDVDARSDDVESDGRSYDKKRDPPGQKSIYINPGDPEKETYRLSTFMKFPQTIPINVCLLAAHGFLYTGYKDRVKCFSCGSNIQDWAVGDDPKSARWHLKGCELVLGTETLNQPIGGRPVHFEHISDSSIKSNRSIDSGYGSVTSGRFTDKPSLNNYAANPSSSLEACGSPPIHLFNNNKTQVATVDPCDDIPKETVVSGTNASRFGSDKEISSGIKMMQIGNNNTMTFNNNNAHSNDLNGQNVRQTARVVETNKRIIIQGLEIATIVSNSHRDKIYNQLDLRKEEDRRKSFATWSCNYINVTVYALAKSGFFYLGNLDRVQCFSCSGVLRNWTSNDNVDQEHERHFPRCKMVLGTDVRNVALPWSPIEATVTNRRVEQITPDPQTILSRKKDFPCLHPVNPHMMSEQSRLETFDYRWPTRYIKATKEEIAKAGFYFLGERDRTKCWYCNGGLQNWDPNDDPWTEHAKWFPGCEFLLSQKGVEFVMGIVRRFPSIRRPTLRNSRLDYLTGRVVNPPLQSAESPAKLTNSQSTQSAGALLQSMSSSSSQTQPSYPNDASSSVASTPNIPKIEKDVENMGFTKEQIKLAVDKKRSEERSYFTTVGQLIDAILQMESTASTSAVANGEVTMETNITNVGEEIKCANPPSLKRNNELLGGNNSKTNELASEETPRKVSKTGLGKSQELVELENERKCKVCYDQLADTVIIPCGHLSLCHNCSHKTNRCPVCRCKVQSVIKAYLV